MQITVICDCGKKIRLQDSQAGQRGRCPECSQQVTVPPVEFFSTHDGKTVRLSKPRGSGAPSGSTGKAAPSAGDAKVGVRCRCGQTWTFTCQDAPGVVQCRTEGCRGFAMRPHDDVIQRFAGRVLTPEQYREATGNWYAGLVIEGQYEIRGAAAGGMGNVYFAHHRGWGMPVAIKSPQRQILESERKLQRFLREIDAWASLESHLNLVQCYYAKTVEGVPCVFIEYVEGGSLADVVPYGTQAELNSLLRWGVQACDGMSVAHRHNLIHRDLKPQNVLVGSDGNARITDFGLVKEVDTSDESDPEADDMGRAGSDRSSGANAFLTADGRGMGTPPYMPPEQWVAAHAVGPPADIYAFGAMLYQLACGQLPFVPSQATKSAFRELHLNAPVPDPRKLRPDLPEPVANAIMTCLQKEPEARFASFALVRGVLASAYEGLANEPIPEPMTSEAEQARDLNNRAVTLVDLDRAAEAIEALERVVTRQPSFVPARYNLGLLRMRVEETAPAEAVREYDSGPKELISDWRYHYHRGLLHLGAGAFAAAQSDLMAALRQRPHEVEVLNARGLSLLLAGEPGPAAVCLRRAARIAPDRLDVQENLALSLRQQGDRKEAARIFERIAQDALFGAEDRARYAVTLALDGKTKQAKLQMEQALRQGGSSPLVQTLAAEAQSSLDEFLPLTQAVPVEGIDAAEVVRSQAKEGRHNLRANVNALLISGKAPTDEARREKVREVGRGLCPHASARDPLILWDCMRKSLSYLGKGRALGAIPLRFDALYIAAVALAVLLFPGYAMIRGNASFAKLSVYGLTIAAPAIVAVLLSRLGLAWFVASVPFALAAIVALIVDITVFKEAVGLARIFFVLGFAAFGLLFTRIYQRAAPWLRAFWV